MKRFCCLLLCLCFGATVFVAAGCGKNSKITVINVMNMDGGVGNEWLDEVNAAFKTKYAQKSYKEGKTGIKVEVTPAISAGTNIDPKEGNHVYFFERTDVQGLINKGYLYDLSDIVNDSTGGRSIASIIRPEVKRYNQDANGHFYALPHYEFYSGLTYDVETFENKKLYIADAKDVEKHLSDYITQKKITVFSKFGVDVAFTGVDTGVKLSCGPDGICGTKDDGLPTSIQELMALCAYMPTVSVSPIALSGRFKNMSNYLMAGLWTSLAGAQQMRTIYTFDSSDVYFGEGDARNGKIEVVKQDASGKLVFKNEKLFEGIKADIYKPETEWIEITSENGYRTNDMAAKYYAAAFMEIIRTEGWLAKDSTGDTIDHTTAQSQFIYGDNSQGAQAKGMLVEASYWANESREAGNFDRFYVSTNRDETQSPRRLAWMNLPVTLDTTVTEENVASLLGKNNAISLEDAGMGSCAVNVSVEGDAEMEEAVKDFIQFVYSDEWLAKFTAKTGCFRPLEYTVGESIYNAMPPLYKDLYDKRTAALEKDNIVFFGADNPVFLKYGTNFKVNLECVVFEPFDGRSTFKSFYQSYLGGMSVKDAFEATRFTADDWNSFA